MRKLMPITYVVLALVIVLSASTLFLDIAHPLGNPFK